MPGYNLRGYNENRSWAARLKKPRQEREKDYKSVEMPIDEIKIVNEQMEAAKEHHKNQKDIAIKIANLKEYKRLRAIEYHLDFIYYVWNNPSEPYKIGCHTRLICKEIDDAISRYRNGESVFKVIMVPYRHGKALHVGTPVFTTTGWKNHGDLQPGDYVFSADGQPRRVIANTGVYEWDTVKIIFNHGEEIICAREHLWEIKRAIDNRKGKARIKTGPDYIESVVETQDIELPTRSRGNRPPFIEITKPLQMPEQKLPIDPYVLGVWLGDGNSANNYVTKSADDISFLHSQIKSVYPGSEIKHEHYDGENYRLLISGLLPVLRQSGLLKNKHIPHEYFTASEKQRWSLVQGLMDTDGYTDKRGLCEFTQINRRLADDFLFLIRSLGIRATIGEYDAKIRDKIIGKKYRVCFTPKRDMPVFTLPRKLGRIQNKSMADGIEKDRFYIKSIEPNGKAVVNCIQVEGGVYLVGRELVPTHNSEIISRKLPAHFLGLFPDDKILLTGHTASLTSDFSWESRELIENPKYKELFPDIMLSKNYAAADHWRLSEKEGECFASGLGGSMTGRGYSLGIVDDYCRNRADAESPTVRNRMWNSFTNDFLTRRAPKSITLVTATPWHVDDIIGRIKNKMKEDPYFPKFQIISLPAFSDEYPTGTLFPERFSKAWYDEQRASLGEYGTASLLQCNPVTQGGNILQVDNVVKKPLTEFPDMVYYRVWDLAHTEKERTSPDPDYTSGTLLGFRRKPGAAKQWELWIKDVKRFRLDAPRRDNQILNITAADGPYVKVGIENSVDSKDALRTLQNILIGQRVVSPIKNKGDKVTRAAPLEPLFENGNVFVPENAPWLQSWIDELASFPSGGHDDQVDNLSAGYALCTKTGGVISVDLYEH